MGKIRKIGLSLVFEAALLGAAALLLIQSYGNLGSIPEQQLIYYCFWLMLAFGGMIIVGNINLFYITEATKRAQEPPQRSPQKKMTPKKKDTSKNPKQRELKEKKASSSSQDQKEAPPKPKQDSPKAWKNEEFE
jgi:outer membrane biosynthesis protein TonB